MIYYPQAAVTLRVLFEDFHGKKRDKSDVFVLRVQAKRVRVSQNDYTQADTFSCDIDYKDFPFDPRCIRACGVTVHMENMEKLGERISPTYANTVFIGFADDDNIKLNDSGRTVTLEGRDYTGILIDRKYFGPPVPLNWPVDEILMKFFLNLEELKDIRVVNATGQPLPVLSEYAPDFNELGTKANTRRDESYWDLIQRLIARSGLICYFALDKLIITKPRALYNKSKAKRLVYGHNLKELGMKRKLGRVKNFNVKVNSMNIESKEVLEVKIPENATDEWSKETGVPNGKPVFLPQLDKKKDGTEKDPEPAPYISFRVPNISSKDHLIKIGQEIYEEMGRQQLEGDLETREMDVMEVSGQNFDILKLRVGDPLSVEIDQGDMEDLRMVHGSADISSYQARVEYLVKRGYAPKVAAAFASSLGEFTTLFYTKEIEFSMDYQDGFKCRIDFINFIELPERLKNGNR